MSLGSSGLPFSEQGGIERSCSLGTGVHFGACTPGKNNTVHVSSFLKSCLSRKLFSCLWLLACSMWPFNKDLCFDSRVSHQRTQPRGTGVLTVNMSGHMKIVSGGRGPDQYLVPPGLGAVAWRPARWELPSISYTRSDGGGR